MRRPVAEPLGLDHVAFWVSGRETIASRCEELFGMHAIDRQETFTLMGRDARRGKLTLFDAEGPREPGLFRGLGLRVNDLEAARSLLPLGTPETIDLGEGILVRLVEADTDVDFDLDHVVLGSPDPRAAAGAYELLGFSIRDQWRLEVAGAFLELEPAPPSSPARPLLNHLALRVTSVDAWLEHAHAQGIEVDSTVDAPNTRAVFLRGPDGVRVEFVEHKPTFSLV